MDLPIFRGQPPAFKRITGAQYERPMGALRALVVALSGLLVCAEGTSQTTVSGLVQVSVADADKNVSFLSRGPGALRFDDKGPHLQQAVIRVEQDLSPVTSIDVILHGYSDGDQRAGVSQFQLNYRPVSADSVKWRARAGVFYPRMSVENLDIGWTSPFTYTPSAINSWIGEELRVAGAEVTFYSPGRQRRSSWSWELHASAFMGNDPTGTLLAWRGFALHDRQSLHHDRINFPPIPSIVQPDPFNHPAWVEPFREIDHRVGFYLGGHLRYLKTAELRYYYYDNQADPLAVNSDRLYAWRTKFHATAARYSLSPNTRLMAQWLTGSTEMGPKLVFADFDAFYLMLSHRIGEHRLSARWDRFRVKEDDLLPDDPNDSDGHGLTLAWRFSLSSHWKLGLEWHHNQTFAANRSQLALPTEMRQRQWLSVVEYRW